MNKEEKFDNFIEKYTKLTKTEKETEIINQIKKMIARIMYINQKLGRKHELLINKELLDLNNIPISDDDFLEGLFVYIHSLDDELSNLLNSLMFKENERKS